MFGWLRGTAVGKATVTEHGGVQLCALSVGHPLGLPHDVRFSSPSRVSALFFSLAVSRTGPGGPAEGEASLPPPHLLALATVTDRGRGADANHNTGDYDLLHILSSTYASHLPASST